MIFHRRYWWYVHLLHLERRSIGRRRPFQVLRHWWRYLLINYDIIKTAVITYLCMTLYNPLHTPLPHITSACTRCEKWTEGKREWIKWLNSHTQMKGIKLQKFQNWGEEKLLCLNFFNFSPILRTFRQNEGKITKF